MKSETDERAIEAVCAEGYLQAGADILIMAHPEAIKTINKTTK